MGDEPQVVRRDLASQVYAALQALVLNLEFAPGSKLVIDQLAARIGVSATPVREALGRLAAEHLVEFAPYRGFRVLPEPSSDELRASFEARRAIEEFAARVGCARASNEVIRELRASAERISEREYSDSLDDYLEFLRRNRDFHERIVVTAANPYLSEAARSLFHEALISRTLGARGIPDLSNIMEEHDAIVVAFEQRDADAAAAAVIRHGVSGAARMLQSWGERDLMSSRA